MPAQIVLGRGGVELDSLTTNVQRGGVEFPFLDSNIQRGSVKLDSLTTNIQRGGVELDSLTTNIQRGGVELDFLTTNIQRLCIWCPSRLVTICLSNLMQLSRLPTIPGTFVTMTKSGHSRIRLLYKTHWPYPRVSVRYQVIMPEVVTIKGSSQSTLISLYICIHPCLPTIPYDLKIIPAAFPVDK